MADIRGSAGSTPMTKRTFASRINKKGHVAMRREAASMYLPDSTPIIGGVAGGAANPSPGLLQGINPHLYGGSGTTLAAQHMVDVIEPLDFEEYMTAQQTILERDPMKHLLEFPTDDIMVSQLPPKSRTTEPILPEEGAELDPHIRDCIKTYTSDYTVVTRRYQAHSSAICPRDQQMERNRVILETPLQEFAVDLEPGANDDRLSMGSTSEQEAAAVNRASSSFLDESTASSETSMSTTPRGSWASAIFDLKSTESDDLLKHVLDRSVSAEDQDKRNHGERAEERHQSIYSLYPMQLDDEMVERRLPADPPSASTSSASLRIFLQCLQLKLGLSEIVDDVEPIFASLALYDVQAKKKVSENFYFDVNSDSVTSMIPGMVNEIAASSKSRSAIVEVTFPNPDLCLVVRLEKVLQPGDISEVLRPYLEEDKNKEKVKANAASFCERLGAYRMPIAWTGIYIMQYITGRNASSLDMESRRVGGGSMSDTSFDDVPRSGSLERGLSASSGYSSFRRRGTALANDVTSGQGAAADSPVFTRGSMDRRSGQSDRGGRSASLWGGSSTGQDPSDLGPPLSQGNFAPGLYDDFQPVKLTVNSFFKQEVDKLNDDDLYRALTDLKRPTASLRRLKSISGTLCLEMSPAPEDYPGCLSPELYPVISTSASSPSSPAANTAQSPPASPTDAIPAVIPIKCLMEFPAHQVYSPHNHYRNLLYVSPLNLNFTNRGGQARNIAVKVQFMGGEEESFAMPVIFGKSSSPEFLRHAYLPVTWHNKSPDFYEEIKIRLPAKIGDQHHLKFTFYHISCQKKADQPNSVETPIGWTWVPMLTNNRQTGELHLTTGEHNLPVASEKLPPNYHVLSPDVELPGIKWVDNHKPLFKLRIDASTSIHTQDECLDHFLFLAGCAETTRLPRHIEENRIEQEMRNSVEGLESAKAERLVHFLPLIFDKLLLLLVRPPSIGGQTLMLHATIFETIGRLVRKLKEIKELKESTDKHGRCALITSYIQYRVSIPTVETTPSSSSTSSRSGNETSAMTTSTSMTQPISSFAGMSTGGGYVRPTSRPPLPPGAGGRAEGVETPPPQVFGRSNSNPDIMPPASPSPAGEDSSHASAFDRQGSLRAGNTSDHMTSSSSSCARKCVHEELALQWIVASGKGKEVALSQANFYFELIIKSMSVYLHQNNRLNSTQRQGRFPQHYMDDLRSLVENVTREIVVARDETQRDAKLNVALVEQLNNSLAFFIYDLLSLVDRGFVFKLINKYCEQISFKISTVNMRESVAYYSLRLDLLRIVCSHEHFVALNLPFSTPLPSSLEDNNNSPTPSINSSISNASSLTSSGAGTMVEKGLMTELSYDFRQQHYLIGLVLCDLEAVLQNTHNASLHSKAVNLVRGLLTSHDMDPRYASTECRARVAALYLPLLGIVMDAIPQLFDPNSDDARPGAAGENGAGAGAGVLSRRSSIHEKGTVRIKSGFAGGAGDTSDPLNHAGPNSGGAHRNPSQQRPHSMDAATLLAASSSEDASHDAHSAALYGDVGGLGGHAPSHLDLYHHPPSRPQLLNQDTTRHLMTSFLWVTKNTDQNILRSWWSESANRLDALIDVLELCVSNFEYKGRKMMKRQSTLATKRVFDMRRKLELSIAGTGSARMEFLKRRAAGVDRSPGSGSGSNNTANATSGEAGTRFDKETWFQSMMDAQNAEKNRDDFVNDAHIEGNLATEVNLIVLDMLEHVIHVATVVENNQTALLSGVMRVILHALSVNQSTRALTCFFATQRAMVSKFLQLLFQEETDQCADLCLRLLAHCASRITDVRSNATASLYLLMRQNFERDNNFARVKMQITMSLSTLVGQHLDDQKFSEAFLRRSLKTILSYADADEELSSFPEQVRDMAFNLHMILSDTVKMKEFQKDHEMLLDLMYRIAKGYQTSPDLRLTWLQTMKRKHEERGNHVEAGLCIVHCAALVAEYLHMLEDRTYLPVGCVGFERISTNVLEESAISDDVVSPDEEGVCTGQYFSTPGLVGLLESAAALFQKAQCGEIVNEVYKILIPIHEAHREYAKLQHIHDQISAAFAEIVKNAGKRFFGSYFRVGFYGANFKDLDGEEFVYKEPVFTKLGDISNRLESFYSDRFGPENVVIIKDSRVPEKKDLDPDKAYIQVTYVEPHFDEYERKERVTEFEKNFRLRRFVYSTPFTEDGKHHGELSENFIRKTILTVANTFPYIKKRINVVDREFDVLTPIEVALEDIQKKVSQLVNEINREPCDTRMLQLVLQGCIGTTVNQGPMEIATVFLSPVARGEVSATMHHTRLRLAFKEFSRRCKEALQKNKQLTGSVQREFHNEMHRNYMKFVERLTPLIAKEGAPMEGTLRRSPKKRHLPVSTPLNAALHAASSFNAASPMVVPFIGATPPRCTATPPRNVATPPRPASPHSVSSQTASPMPQLITSPNINQQQQPHAMHAFRQSSLLLSDHQDV